MVFPAFMIGSAFGILLIVGLAGTPGLKSLRPIVCSIAGSLVGLVAFLFTQSWWPPVLGPFVLCPAFAAAAALIGRRKP